VYSILKDRIVIFKILEIRLKNRELVQRGKLKKKKKEKDAATCKINVISTNLIGLEQKCGHVYFQTVMLASANFNLF
jgi:hypothetical protein